MRRKDCLSEQSRRNCEGKVRRNNFKQLESAFATIESIEEEPDAKSDKTESEQLESVSDNREETEDDENKNQVGTSSVAVEDAVELRREKEKGALQQGGKGLFARGKDTLDTIRRSISFSFSGPSLWPKSQPKTLENPGSPKPSKSPLPTKSSEPTKSPKPSISPDKQKGTHLYHS